MTDHSNSPDHRPDFWEPNIPRKPEPPLLGGMHDPADYSPWHVLRVLAIIAIVCIVLFAYWQLAQLH